MMTDICLFLSQLKANVFRTNTSKLVWFCLMRDVDDAGMVKTSALSIAREIEVNEKTVRNALNALQKEGLIELQSPILNPKKVRYMGRIIKLNGLDVCSKPKKSQIRKKSDIQSDITPLKKPTKFTPPTDEEVAAYCQEKGYHFNPAQFVPHYQKKGWIVGKTKMVDWHAACRTWEISWKEKYGERFYYEIQPIITADNAASRKAQRDRGLSLATEIVARSENLLSLFNGSGADPDTRKD